MKDALLVNLLSVLPRRRLSRWMGRALRLRLPGWLRRRILRWYVGRYGVDLSECEGGIDDFDSLSAFFVRALRPGARPVAPEPEALVSPVDGTVYSVGRIGNGSFPQGGDLSVVAGDLLGGDERYADGEYIAIYLSPRDYHRVHSPREGRVLGYRYRPGQLWPVFPGATRRVRDLFAGNERLVIRLATDLGEIACVMVGAFGVGRMTLSFHDVVTNTGQAAADHQFSEPLAVERAAELGRFGMGSTVILLAPRGSMAWEVGAGEAVRLGQRIGRGTG